MVSSDILGSGKVKRLMFVLGWPAAVNFLIIAIYNLTDVIFVGYWLGTMQIAAVVIVGTIHFLFSAFGLAVGIGGASIISRSLGEKDIRTAACVLGNQIILVGTVSLLLLSVGMLFEDDILTLFGAYGNIFEPAKLYYKILLFGIPFLSLSMMGNNAIQAEGKARVAMFNSIVPTIVNIVLNPILLQGFKMGIEGAAWATLVAYILGFLLVFRFFIGHKSELDFNYSFIRIDLKLMREIMAIGASVMINVVSTNVFIVLLNKMLFKYQNEAGIVIYSIISRINMLFLIPIIGIDGGIRPIIGYSFGSRQLHRIRETMNSAIIYGIAICYILLGIVLIFADPLIRLFTNDHHIVEVTHFAMRVVLSFFPLFVIEVITIAYFQSIGKPQIALFLTLLRNVFLLIPLMFVLPHFFGYKGILYTFPVVDVLTTVSAFWLLRKELIFRLPMRIRTASQ